MLLLKWIIKENDGMELSGSEWRESVGSCECGHGLSCSAKCPEFLDKLVM